MDKKNELNSGATEASAPATRAHHAGGGGAEAGQGKRLSATKKLAAVQRLDTSIYPCIRALKRFELAQAAAGS